MKSLVEELLKGIAEVLDVIGGGEASVKLNPLISTYTLLILVFVPSYSNTLITPSTILVYSLVLTCLLRVDFKLLMKPLTPILCFSVLMTLPILFTEAGYLESLAEFKPGLTMYGLSKFLQFNIRVLASAYVLALLIAWIGWRRVISALGKGPFKGLAWVLKLFLTMLPNQLRYLVSLLLAREARSFEGGLKGLWKTGISSLGGLMLASTQRSRMLSLSIRARSFNKMYLEFTDEKLDIKLLDLAFIAASTLLILASIMVELYGYP